MAEYEVTSMTRYEMIEILTIPVCRDIKSEGGVVLRVGVVDAD